MQQYTTPTLTINITPNDAVTADIIQESKLFVTIKQGKLELTKTAKSVGTTVTIVYSQEETSELKDGSIKLQIRGITPDGFAWATQIVTIDAETVILKEVIDYA